MPDLSKYKEGLLDEWGVTRAELNYMLAENPSSRGLVTGYVAEIKLEEQLEHIPGINDSRKFDDHDRSNKHDREILYKENKFRIESKSLQSNSVEYIKRNSAGWDKWKHLFKGKPPRNGFHCGTTQVDASDSREVTFPDGSLKTTTLLLTGDFDILAVNLFEFLGRWQFVFARNEDLETSSYHTYTPHQQENLIKSLQRVTWPPAPPFHKDIVPLLESDI